MRWIVWVVGLALAGGGCSGTSKKKADDADSSWDMDGSDPEPASDGETPPETRGDDDDDDDASAPKPKPKPKPPTRADDYEINHTDCDALARAYGGAWENDEMKKLNARKLPEKQFEKAAADVKKSGAEMATNWREECYKTVGTAYLRSRLQCAVKAKSLERFNNCMDGVAD